MIRNAGVIHAKKERGIVAIVNNLFSISSKRGAYIWRKRSLKIEKNSTENTNMIADKAVTSLNASDWTFKSTLKIFDFPSCTLCTFFIPDIATTAVYQLINELQSASL